MSRPPKLHAPIDANFENVLTAIADERMPTIQAATARPFLKWVGGKRSILSELIARMPESFGAYCEPFLGGGALFFERKPPKAYLSDLNFYLVLAFRAVRDDVERLISELKVHEKKHDKDYYLKARVKIAREDDLTKIAAWMIYLNKTCYNGLYRVNLSGAFNVPMGSYAAPAILDEQNLRACSKALQEVEIMQHDFEQTPLEKGNFYYLDPPFHNTFSSFDSSGFEATDHRKLAAFCKRLDEAGCLFMVSNSETPLIHSLYDGYVIDRVKAGRFVSCKSTGRVKQNELIIRNYGTERQESEKDGQPS